MELSAEESVALQDALRSYLSDLRMEIVDTDNPEYRRTLRHEQGLLQGVLDRIERACTEASELDADGRVVVRLVTVWARG